MKKLFAVIFIALAGVVAAGAEVSKNESLNYRVMFKWGLVNKQAGRVNLSTKADGASHAKALLVARSEKWADKFYAVRDTLKGRLNASTCEPSYYEKISHEGGEYKRDVIDYERSGEHVKAYCKRWKQKSKKHALTTSETVHEADGFTVDMLSSFYYMRNLDYDKMQPGQKTEMNIFSGKQKERLSIVYQGREDVKIDGTVYPAYKITFRFTGKGGKKTSDDMAAWISTDVSRIPLKLEGKLPVGKVQCFYVK